MFKKLSICAVVVITMVHGTLAYAGPFGTEMGDSLDKFKDNREVKPYLFSTKTLPKGYPAFESYTLGIHPSTGLCLVTGLSYEFNNNRYGNGLRTAFSDLRKQLDGIYGTSSLFDHLNAGALWKDPSDWVMAISQNERKYQAVWKATSGNTLKDNVVEILLTARAHGPYKSWFFLQYRYKNYDECSKLVSSSTAGSL